MLKRLFTVLFIVLMLSNSVEAKPLRLSLGVKTWFADWLRTTSGNRNLSYAGAVYGPVAHVSYNRMFVGATYLLGFFKNPLVQRDDVSNQAVLDEVDTIRTDVEFTAGYYVTRYLGLLGGYKYLDYTATLPPGRGTDTSTPPKVKSEAKGPFVGFLGSYPLGKSRFALFGTFTYAWLARDFTQDRTVSGNFNGPSVELGLAYRMPKYPVNFTGGYKYQRYEDTDLNTSDTFQGLNFSGTYTF